MARVIEEADPTDDPGHCDKPPGDRPGLNDESPGEWGTSPGEPFQPPPDSQQVHPRANVRTNRGGNSVKRNTEGNSDGGDTPRRDDREGRAGTKGIDPSVVQAHFDVFWSIYPKRIGRHEAELKFVAALKHGADPDAIIAAARAYAAAKSGHAEQHIKTAANWLYAEPWRDPPTTPAGGGKTIDQEGNTVDVPRRPAAAKPRNWFDLAQEVRL
jgi:hypothetical protein